MTDLCGVCITQGFRGTKCSFYTKMPSILISSCALSMTEMTWINSKHFLKLFVVCCSVTKSYPTLCNAMDCAVHETLQPRVRQWVTYPFFSGSSWPRNQTGVSFIAGGLFTSWAIGEALTKAGTMKAVGTIKWVDRITVVTIAQEVKVKSPSRVCLFATPRAVAHQAPASMECPRQEHWSGLPFGLKRR